MLLPQARGRWKNDYYSDDDDEVAAPAKPAAAARPSQAAPAAAGGRPGGKASKDPAVAQRLRLLASEAQASSVLCEVLVYCVHALARTSGYRAQTPPRFSASQAGPRPASGSVLGEVPIYLSI